MSSGDQSPPASATGERILILAPLGNDARLTAQFLQAAGLDAEPCANPECFAEAARAGCGAWLLAEEALELTATALLRSFLAAQPSWSDLPIVIIASGGGEVSAQRRARLASFGPGGNVSILERPFRPATLVSTLQAALRARRRQYEVRDLLAQSARDTATLRDASRRKDEFLAMLAHELRNPLASVTNAATLLREGTGDNDRAWAAEVITRQSSQLARLVDDLLDVSRITRGKIELRLERLDVARCLESACEAVAPEIAARHHTLLADYPRGEMWAVADPTRLEQIVVNLLGNAAKYTGNGGHIGLAAQAADGEIILRVSDDGIGIPPQHIPVMFELFAQGERSAARTEGGLGIGLTVVRGLCELHGGSVAAESEGVGKGSTFTVRLPAADPAERPPRNGHSATATPTPRTGTRILVVDDNVDTAAGLSRLLTRRGYFVELAHDGPSAVEKARAFAPAAVLLDIGLPGMDGYEVARHLRADPATVGSVILALSGYGQEEDRTRSRAAGFDHHLVKPIDFAVLQTLLGEFLRNHPLTAAPAAYFQAHGSRRLKGK